MPAAVSSPEPRSHAPRPTDPGDWNRADRPRPAAEPPTGPWSIGNAAPVPALPPYPHGWTPAAWDALRRSPANRAANRIHKRADRLLADIADFVNDFGPDVDRRVLEAAEAPLPTHNPDQLAYVWTNCQGFQWVLDQFLGCVGDVLPELPDDEPAGKAPTPPVGHPAAVAGPDCRPTDFGAWLADERAGNPGFCRYFDKQSPADQGRTLDRLRRQHAVRASGVHTAAHRICAMADELHEAMVAFTRDHTPDDWAAAVADLPPADPDDGDPRDHYEIVHNTIRGFAYVVGEIDANLRGVIGSPPVGAAVTAGDH